ncbi:hypothetical protein ACRC7T_09135 [Segnochrobactraceae bacterium EtOH-i3]
MRLIRSMIVAVAMTVAGVALAAGGVRVAFPALGISIERPADWQVGALEDSLTVADAKKLDETGVVEFLNRNGNRPVLSLSQHPQGFTGVNPTVRVSLRPLGTAADLDARQLLEKALPAILKSFPEATVKVAPHEAMIGTIPAAFARIDYTLPITATGDKASVTSDIWVVKRPGHALVIGAGYASGDQVAAEAIAAIVGTIKVD